MNIKHFFLLFQLTLISLVLLVVSTSCKQDFSFDNLELDNSYDLKAYGSFNSIKIIDNSLLLLDATNSELLMLENDSLYSILKIDIKNRAFLQDFAILDSLFYFSNTYDEIFVLNENGIFIDTIHVSNPNTIEIIKLNTNTTNLILTERISKFKTPRLISYQLNYENDLEILEAENFIKHSKIVKSMFNSDILYRNKTGNIKLLSNRTNKLYSYKFDTLNTGKFEINTFEISSAIDKSLFSSIRFGNFYHNESKNILKIIAENPANNRNYLLTLKKNDNKFYIIDIDSFKEKFDITVCTITDKEIYAYDYLNQKLLYYKFK